MTREEAADILRARMLPAEERAMALLRAGKRDESIRERAYAEAIEYFLRKSGSWGN